MRYAETQAARPAALDGRLAVPETVQIRKRDQYITDHGYREQYRPFTGDVFSHVPFLCVCYCLFVSQIG